MKRRFGAIAILFLLSTAGQTQAAYVPSGPIVGVHFGNNGSAPTNWTRVSSLTPVVNNLTDDTGAITDVSLSFYGGSQNFYRGNLQSHTLPTYTTGLENLNGNIYGMFGYQPWAATLSNLTANTAYNIWVFGVRFGYTIGQHVTISGSGTPLDFDQSGVGDSLFINGVMGNSASRLDDYANTITSSATGTISVLALPTFSTGGNTYSISGIAIQPIAQAPPNAVPEPTSMVLLAMGGLGMAGIRFVRRRVASAVAANQW